MGMRVPFGIVVTIVAVGLGLARMFRFPPAVETVPVVGLNLTNAVEANPF